MLQRILFLLGSYCVFQNINLYFIAEGFTTRRIGLVLLFILFLINSPNIDLKKIDKFSFHFICFLLFNIFLHAIIFQNSFINPYYREILSGFFVITMFSILFKETQVNLRDLEILTFFTIFNFIVIFIQFKEYGEFSIWSLRIHNVDNNNWNLNIFFNSLIFFSPLYLLGYIFEKKTVKRLTYLILLIINLFVIVLSTSRQAIFGSLILLLPFIVKKLNFKSIITFSTIAIVLAYTTLFDYVELSYNSLLSRFDNGSDYYRLNKYLDTIYYFSKDFIGIGLGNNISLNRGPLESSYLQILIELGLLGTIISLLFYSKYFFSVFFSRNIVTKYCIYTIIFISFFNEILLATNGIIVLYVSYKFKNYKLI